MILNCLNKLVLDIRGSNWNKMQQLEIYIKIYTRMNEKILVPIEEEVRKFLKYTLIIEQ
jgi:hypothetical protein